MTEYTENNSVSGSSQSNTPKNSRINTPVEKKTSLRGRIDKSVDSILNDQNTIRLIEAVELRPCLWNYSLKLELRTVSIRDGAWNGIREEFDCMYNICSALLDYSKISKHLSFFIFR